MNYFKTRHGFRLCAIDGTTIRLSDEADIANYFGVQKGKANQADHPMGMAMAAQPTITTKPGISNLNIK